MIRFVILSMPRTGSNMVTQRLSTHPDIVCYPAILSANGWYKKGVEGGGVLRLLRERMDPRWLSPTLRLDEHERLFSELFEANQDKPAVGFKHHLPGIPEKTEPLLTGDLHKVILTRNNYLAAYSSNKVATITGQGAARVGDSVVAAKCEFDAREFEAFRKRREAIYGDARATVTGNVIEMDYTEARTPGGLARLCSFLGVDPNGVGAAPTLKRNSDKIVDRFDNPDAVLAHLHAVGLEHWTEEQSPK